jgi:glycosyltransferase 2 family protein
MSDAAQRRGFPAWIPAVLLAAVLLYFALRGVEWRRVGEIIAGAQWRFLIASLGTVSFALFLRAFRWRILLNTGLNPGAPGETQGRLSIATVFWATAAGYLGNQLLPARAGELVRTFLISAKSGLSKTFVLTTALSERIMDAISLILFSSLALLTVESQPAWVKQGARSLAVVATASALAIAVLPYIHGFIETLLGKLHLPAGLRDKLLQLIGQVILGVRTFHDFGRFAGFAALTVVIWTTDTCSALLTARALGLHLSFAVALLFLTALGLGSALPSTPGYVGIYQIVAVTVLGPFGIGKDPALAYVIVMQAISYVIVIAYGGPGVIKLGGSLSAIRKMSRE